MGRKEDVLFLARKRTKSVAEETGKIQGVGTKSPLQWGPMSHFQLKRWASTFLESQSFIPREEAPIPGWPVQHRGGSCTTLSASEVVWLSRIFEGEEWGKGGAGERGDRAFVYAVP